MVLRRPESDQDVADIVRWMSEESAAAALSNDAVDHVTAAMVRQLLDSGFDAWIVGLHDGSSVGLASWKKVGAARAFELALVIADPELWRRGIGAEAALRVVDHLFFTVGAHRVAAVTGSHNPYATPALARGGFTLDGILRDYYFIDGQYSDALVWSMLEHEHRAIVTAAARTPWAYQQRVPDEERRRAADAVDAVLAEGRASGIWAPGPSAPRATAVGG